MGIPRYELAAGVDATRAIDAILVNAPLRDYTLRPRVNDFTLPVLGMAYIATYAEQQGFNVGVIDAEALGLGLGEVQVIINALKPRWVGFNLLAPTYEMSAQIAAQLNPSINILLGSHQAKAMPREILQDPRFGRTEALVIGEAETRVADLLRDVRSRERLPQVMWRDRTSGILRTGDGTAGSHHLAPDINSLTFVDRKFLVDDPFLALDGRVEANMVGARGCPYDCSFCGAAVSANPDVTIRSRLPENIILEMNDLNVRYGVTAFRFVDDLFLGHPRFIRECTASFAENRIGDRFVWDATGRINVLHRMSDEMLAQLASNGCREVALGIESGSERMLKYVDKRITPEMAKDVVRRLTTHGISVKGYFILGLPTETREDLNATVRLVHDLWDLADQKGGRFRASVFEFRPYPGTPEWHRIIASGQYKAEELLDYAAVDLTEHGLNEAMRDRDEFNFSVNLQFGEATIAEIRHHLTELSYAQYRRKQDRA